LCKILNTSSVVINVNVTVVSVHITAVNIAVVAVHTQTTVNACDVPMGAEVVSVVAVASQASDIYPAVARCMTAGTCSTFREKSGAVAADFSIAVVYRYAYCGTSVTTYIALTTRRRGRAVATQIATATARIAIF
jgi:hypothetical protein